MGKKNQTTKPNPEHTFLSLERIWWNLLAFKYLFRVGAFQGLQGLPGDKGVRVSYQKSSLCLIANTCTQWQPSKLLSTCCSQHVFVCQTFIQGTLPTCVLEGDTHSSFHHMEHLSEGCESNFCCVHCLFWLKHRTWVRPPWCALGNPAYLVTMCVGLAEVQPANLISVLLNCPWSMKKKVVF